MGTLEEAARRFLSDEDHPWQSAYASFLQRADWVESAAVFWALNDLSMVNRGGIGRKIYEIEIPVHWPVLSGFGG